MKKIVKKKIGDYTLFELNRICQRFNGWCDDCYLIRKEDKKCPRFEDKYLDRYLTTEVEDKFEPDLELEVEDNE